MVVNLHIAATAQSEETPNRTDGVQILLPAYRPGIECM